jgi:RNase H-fold protein (predicted Holliday junction resolvase)
VEYFRPTTILPIILWDEQMSSQDAFELARQKRRPSSSPLDDLAARVILQSYLDAIRDGMIPMPDLIQEQE